ncbi:hypothetical protein NBRC3257_2651 [Gluconobacter thailandicus NBRC 3257]|uniref:Transposase n=1 Tax=Gluconobacter thailandicus NBRC 3257 TaxID=1381097 RepID=A0ABQ0IZL7_GLUTH|nr:hypothetical protein NBRC3255_2135 [Gluconobacter thailandicus NBRC 3255]GAD27652.1 hypothetical protein NBRC3257_2651 [Gluconobacter thailandicus NBRC 3257]
MFSTPSSRRARIWGSVVWASVETRAYPYRAMTDLLSGKIPDATIIASVQD